jgi:hypothetical protein
MSAAFMVAVVLEGGASARAQSSPFSTNFPATENPISQGGFWLNGGVDGVDWGNVQTDGTHAFGVSLPSTYADPTAALKGAWGPDQSAQAVVQMGAQPSVCCMEVELRLRVTITPHQITGYEINFSITNNTYVQIVRWNGPLADSTNSNNGFTYLNSVTGPGLKNGDVLRATIVGNTITAFLNGSQMVQATDTGQGGVGPWTSGSPGMGFFDDADNNWVSFGFSSYSASDDSDAGFDAGALPPDAGIDAGALPPDAATLTEDAGCNSGFECTSLGCCPGLQCTWGEDSGLPSCAQPVLDDAGMCFQNNAVCVPIYLPDGGTYLPPCCPGTECAQTPYINTCQPVKNACGCQSSDGLLALLGIGSLLRRRRRSGRR